MTTFPNIHSLKKNAYKKTVNAFLPNTVLVPLRQDVNGSCRLLVKSGDRVNEGELIASGVLSENTNFSSMIYAPIPGIVSGVEPCICPDGKHSMAVRINLSGSFSYLGKKLQPLNTLSFSRNALLESIALKGIVNTFTTNEPTLLADDLKLSEKSNSGILVVRMFDEDSSRLTDTLLSSMYACEIVKGTLIAAKAMNALGIVFVCGKDFSIPETENINVPFFEMVVDSKKYPSGYKNQLAREILSRKKGEPFSAASGKSMFTDSSTMLELYRSVTFGKPTLSRYVLVSGECLHASGLVNVPLGMSLRELAIQCGGLEKEPGAVIINGYVSGSAIYDLESPVTKYVKSVTFIPERKVPDQRTSVCVGCGSCRRICPEKLSPDLIYRHITDRKPVPKVYLDSARFCTNCVLCNSCCPARLPLSQIIYNYNDFRLDRMKNKSSEKSETEPVEETLG